MTVQNEIIAVLRLYHTVVLNNTHAEGGSKGRQCTDWYARRSCSVWCIDLAYLFWGLWRM